MFSCVDGHRPNKLKTVYLPTSLELECTVEGVIASVEISNNTNNLYIDEKRNGIKGKLFDEIFTIKDVKTDQELQYKGPVDDYKIKEEDLAFFKKGQVIKFSINLSNYYSINMSTGIIVTYIGGAHLFDYKDDSFLFKATSTIGSCQ